MLIEAALELGFTSDALQINKLACIETELTEGL